MASTMQLEFSQAMSDFKTMFPDLDREVIEAVLRANQGAVDATIDQLLAMSTDNQNEKLRNELDATTSPQCSLINLNDSDTDLQKQQRDGQLIDTLDGPAAGGASQPPTSAAVSAVTASTALLSLNSSGGGGGGASPSHHHNTGASPKLRPAAPGGGGGGAVQKTPQHIAMQRPQVVAARRWNPPILGPLPPGFLRIVPAAGDTREYELPDEQFAMMLQNEEFMNQLRWNQEFMSALEKEQQGKAKAEDDAAFKERLKNMGKMSRKKFLQMARVFTWQRNKKATTAKQIDSLPLKEEPSDDEDHHHQPSSQHQTPSQLPLSSSPHNHMPLQPHHPHQQQRSLQQL